MQRISIYIVIVIILLSCNNIGNGLKKHVIARVYDKELYLEDIIDEIPEYYSARDSLILLRNYANKWVKDQLFLNKAEQNLGDKKLKLEQEIEKYRTQLMIYHYQQEIIRQELDTLVEDNEIGEYFNKYLQDFRLTQNIVVALYIKVPRSSSEVQTIRSLYKTDKDSELVQLRKLCNEEDAFFDNFNNNWIAFNKILSVTPARISNKDRFLKNNNSIEESDSLYFHFVNIYDYKLYDTEAPISFVKERITDLILNKRKIKYLQRLENDLYDNAVRSNVIEILVN